MSGEPTGRSLLTDTSGESVTSGRIVSHITPQVGLYFRQNMHIIKLALQNLIVLTGNSKSANSDDEVRFSDFGGVMIPFY